MLVHEIFYIYLELFKSSHKSPFEPINLRKDIYVCLFTKQQKDIIHISNE